MTERPRGLAFFRQRWGKRLGFKARYLMRSKTNRDTAVEKLMDRNGAASQRVPPARFLNLQNAVVQSNRVVLINGSLVLDREYPVQIPASCAHECAARSRRHHRKPPVELAHIFLSQEPVGFLHTLDPPNP